MKYEYLQTEPPEKLSPVIKISVRPIGIPLPVIVKTKGNGWL